MQRNLLLVIQFKAMGIGGACVYDQWLARSKILRGAEQARIAVDYLRLNEKFVETLLAGKKIKNQPTEIQPLIITSSEMFTGWNPNGIPVASIGSVASLLRGATVNYKAATGDIVSTRKFIVGDEPTSDEFLSFLATPLDWRITEEEELVDMRRIQSELGTLWLPELTRRTRPRAKVEFRRSAVES